MQRFHLCCRLAPVIDSVTVDSPAVSLTHLGGGRYDVDDILEKLKRPADSNPDKPPRFALYNLSLNNGRLSFAAKTAGKNHELTALNVTLPFLSNLESKRDVKIAPRLAIKLGGSNFDSAAEGTPFAQAPKTDAAFKLSNFELTPYLGYLPAGLPYKLASGVINIDAKVVFEQNPGAVVRLSGVVTANKIKLVDKPGRDLVSFDQLKIVIAEVRPLAQTVKLSVVELTNPALSINRDRAGRFNLLPFNDKKAINTGAGSAYFQAAAGQNNPSKEAKVAPKPSAAPPALWKVDVANVSLRGGAVAWQDETLTKPAEAKFGALTLDASKIAMPFTPDAPLTFSGSMVLAASATTPATINFNGVAADQFARVSTTVAAWPLNMAAKYVGQFLLPALGGQLDATLGVTWQATDKTRRQVLRLIASQASLTEILLAEGKTSLVSIKRVQVDGDDIDLTGQLFKADKL